MKLVIKFHEILRSNSGGRAASKFMTRTDKFQNLRNLVEDITEHVYPSETAVPRFSLFQKFFYINTEEIKKKACFNFTF